MSSPPLSGKRLKAAVHRRVVGNLLTIVTVPFAVTLVAVLRYGPEQLSGQLHEPQHLHRLFVAAFLAAAAATVYLRMLRPRAVYLVDYACFHPTPTCRLPSSTFLEHAKQVVPAFDERSIRFMSKLLARSGLREETCQPPVHFYIAPHKYSNGRTV